MNNYFRSHSPKSLWISTLLFIYFFILCLPLNAAQPEGLRKSSTTGKNPSYKVVGNSKSAKKPANKSTNASKAKKVVAKKKSQSKSYEKVTYKIKGRSRKNVIRSNIPSVILPSPREQLYPKYITAVQSPTDPKLEPIKFSSLSSSDAKLVEMPKFSTSYRGRVAGLTSDKSFVLYSLDANLQEYAKQVIEAVPAPHTAVVAIEPQTGRILAIAGKSVSLNNIITHAGFPAASLIKSVTASAAIEHGGMDPEREIFFRGGTYELSPRNYDPRPTDKNSFTATEALGKSCNPVFSRIALNYLNPALLRSHVAMFGFNNDLRLQVPLNPSHASIPNDSFEFGRTAAGFGDVYISPIHAAALMATFANDGKLPRPTLIDKIIDSDGDTIYSFQPSELRRALLPETAKTLMQMMTATTTMGTSRREFLGKVPWEVAAKTGTLKGTNPKGLNNWFIGSAPLNNPKIAVAVIVVNPSQISSKASHIGRLILERYLG